MGKRRRLSPFCGSVKQNFLSVRVASLICLKDKCYYQVSVILSTCVVTGTMCPSGEAALFACILQVTPPFSPTPLIPTSHIYVRSFVCFSVQRHLPSPFAVMFASPDTQLSRCPFAARNSLFEAVTSLWEEIINNRWSLVLHIWQVITTIYTLRDKVL